MRVCVCSCACARVCVCVCVCVCVIRPLRLLGDGSTQVDIFGNRKRQKVRPGNDVHDVTKVEREREREREREQEHGWGTGGGMVRGKTTETATWIRFTHHVCWSVSLIWELLCSNVLTWTVLAFFFFLLWRFWWLYRKGRQTRLVVMVCWLTPFFFFLWIWLRNTFFFWQWLTFFFLVTKILFLGSVGVLITFFSFSFCFYRSKIG